VQIPRERYLFFICVLGQGEGASGWMPSNIKADPAGEEGRFGFDKIKEIPWGSQHQLFTIHPSLFIINLTKLQAEEPSPSA